MSEKIITFTPLKLVISFKWLCVNKSGFHGLDYSRRCQINSTLPCEFMVFEALVNIRNPLFCYYKLKSVYKTTH